MDVPISRKKHKNLFNFLMMNLNSKHLRNVWKSNRCLSELMKRLLQMMILSKINASLISVFPIAMHITAAFWFHLMIFVWVKWRIHRLNAHSRFHLDSNHRNDWMKSHIFHSNRYSFYIRVHGHLNHMEISNDVCSLFWKC